MLITVQICVSHYALKTKIILVTQVQDYVLIGAPLY